MNLPRTNFTRYLVAIGLLASAAIATPNDAPPRVVQDHSPTAGKPQVSPPPRYRVVGLGTLLQDYPPYQKTPDAYSAASEAFSINDLGQVVGRSSAWTQSIPYGTVHAFLWQNGKMSDLGVLDQGIGSEARAINGKGQVVGDCSWDNRRHAFLWERGKMRDLGTLGGLVSEALAINGKGDVVGYSEIAPASASSGYTGRSLAMLWTPKNGMTALGTFPNTISSTANGINDQDQISGTMVTLHPQALPAVTWENSKPRVIGHDVDPGGIDNQAGGINNRGQLAILEVPRFSPYSKTVPQEKYYPTCINDAGQAVGSFVRSHDPNGFPIDFNAQDWSPEVTEHAFVWQHGKAYDLNACLVNGSAWTLLEARGINAKGQIVGTGLVAINRNDYVVKKRMAFLLTPE